jgi:Mlc titration factor MtfA (ptsG expression regulator)
MLGWKERRRRQLRQRPFPAAWRSVLEDSVPLYRKLPPEDREELHGHIQVLLAEKHFEGTAGLDVTDRMRLIVVAQAAILLLRRPVDYFPKLVSVLLYPGEYSVQEEVEADDGLIEEVHEARAGESWQTGTLILSWEDVERDLVSDLQNVVLHEFAHQLDAESGETNGAPILADRDLRRRWAGAMSEAFERLTEAVERNEETLLDPYGAEDPAEFFAVATEAFFLVPDQLEEEEPHLYAVLRDSFRQDPVRW